MKKVLFITAFFALAACSEDVYQEIDQQNEAVNMMAPPTFDDSNPGYNDGTIHPGSGYVSPWDIWHRNNPFPPSYTIVNYSGASLVMTVTPWVGLAYFDGSNDGRYHDPSSFPAPPVLIADMQSNPGWYPNLYAVNNQEIGNLIPAAPIVMDGSWGYENDLAINSTDHLPVIQANVSPTGNPLQLFFDISGTATPQETQLLADYGKVFYFEVLVTDSGGGFVWQGIVEVENTAVPPGAGSHWQTTGLAANSPGGASPPYLLLPQSGVSAAGYTMDYRRTS